MYEPGTADGDTPATRRWRTMFRVISVHECDGVWAVIPPWSGRLAVLIPWEQVAPKLRSKIEVGGRYHGLAAIGCEHYWQLFAYINEA
jgi:hypothetical protein